MAARLTAKKRPRYRLGQLKAMKDPESPIEVQGSADRLFREEHALLREGIRFCSERRPLCSRDIGKGPKRGAVSAASLRPVCYYPGVTPSGSSQYGSPRKLLKDWSRRSGLNRTSVRPARNPSSRSRRPQPAVCDSAAAAPGRRRGSHRFRAFTSGPPGRGTLRSGLRYVKKTLF
jgi:hypothetical protein